MSDSGPKKRRAEEVARHPAVLEAILETAADAIVTMTASGQVVALNRAAVRLFGYTAEEVIGNPVALLMPEPHHSRHDRYVERYLNTRESHVIGIGRGVEARHKDGRLFPCQLAVSEVRIEGATFFTGILHDLTEQRRSEQAVVEVSEREREGFGREWCLSR